ncbi:MAG: hypothetical protein JSS32_02880, partial [Verrucomicrobia bacterium]|nr:hypothetical protein [Verrucomicrobiota bacterium]
TGPTTTAALYSLRANSSFNVSPGNTYNNVYGSSITPLIQASGSGSVGNIFGSYIQITSTAGTGSPTSNAFGLYIDTASVQNTTTAYGLYVNTPTGAGTNISAYFSTAPFFGTPLSVPNGGTGRTVLTTSGVLIGEGSNNINATAAGTNGQVLIGSSAGDPAFATITSFTGTLTFIVNPNNLSIDLAAPVPIAYGGTNTTTFGNTTSSVLYFTGNMLSSITAGTAGQVLVSNGYGFVPSFQASGGTTSFIDLEGTLLATPPTAILKVGTNYAITGPTTTPSLSDILVSSTFTATPGNTYNNVYGIDVAPTVVTSGSGAVINYTGIKSEGTLSLFGSGTATVNAYGLQIAGTFGANSGTSIANVYGSNITPAILTSGSGSIGTIFGSYIKVSSTAGTGVATSNAFGLYIDSTTVQNTTAAYGLYVNTPSGAGTNISGYFSTAPVFGTPLLVASGGTGRTVLTTSGVVLGEGSNGVNVTAAGTDGQVLIGSSTGDPAFATVSSIAGTLTFIVGHNSLSIDIKAPVQVPYGGTGRTVLTTSGVLIGEGSNTINVTAAGTNGQVLIGSTAGDPAFATITSFTGTLTFIVNPNNLSIDLVAPVPIAFGGT